MYKECNGPRSKTYLHGEGVAVDKFFKKRGYNEAYTGPVSCALWPINTVFSVRELFISELKSSCQFVKFRGLENFSL